MSKIKNGGLDQYGAEPFEQQRFRTAGVEKVKPRRHTASAIIPMKPYRLQNDLYSVEQDAKSYLY